jgi:hypothetical protein
LLPITFLPWNGSDQIVDQRLSLLIRSSGHIVQGRPSLAVRWADIPGLSTCVSRCPASWQQYWQQLWWNGTVARPSVFQAGHIPSWRGSCECYALSPVAAGGRWSLLLLSSLLSTRRRPSYSKPTRTVQGMARVRSGQAPAWPLVSDRSVRRGSGVKRDFACTFTRNFSPCARCPAVTVMLEVGGTDTYTQRAIPGT